MMRLVFILLAALLAAALVTSLFLEEPGYVLLAYGTLSVETSLALFITAAVVLFFLVYVLLRMLTRLWRVPRGLKGLRRRRQAEAARRGLNQGLIEMAEGRWERAEKLLVRSARRSANPLIHWLTAARAAQMQGAYTRRDNYLNRASHCEIGSDVAVELTQAELQIAHGQHEQALATLNHLTELVPKHRYLLKLRARLYDQLRDGAALFELLPELRRQQLLPEADITEMENRAALDLLERAVRDRDLEGARRVWENLHREARHRPLLIQAYARTLVQMEDTEEAETLLRNALKATWDERLVRLYGTLPLEDPAKALNTAEGWVKHHGRDATVLLTLGRLSRRAKLWGKARAYLEASTGVRPDPETYRELAELLEQMGENERAQACYRDGLRLAVE
ncbi:heme biosynthesis HemY N-terminal domain-containing protein [Thioalkalivibrio thiocyanodenitrificans]|uniref:heme biosynthesis HemY N-terminal domain-containing protein n=1 Tax=Thioalkalivibrio thiocyanodenitrificans TaxID=243063 RepID=UPI0003684B77|nr:heme biosynthesis HemY N-terminal domain-containing protein [Thioalkalivibrio thiocyanodenitrificans]